MADGKILQVLGAVVDVEFPPGKLPELFTALTISNPAIDERKNNLLEMRLFGGPGIEETAAALGIAPNTMLRDWNFARAWLRRELSGERLAKSEPREAD